MAATSALLLAAHRVAKEVAAPDADAVDHDARFPLAAVMALKQEQLLSAYIPTEYGGAGASLAELVEICDALARHCAATAMIFAMHQIQVITLVEHALDQEWYRDYLKQLVRHQYLIASVTSEIGVGGEMRHSLCALESDDAHEGEYFKLSKHASTVSYGAQADALLVTARRNPQAAGNDQVLVLLQKTDYTLTATGVWDTMGMRGTCSPPFDLAAHGHAAQIIDTDFASMAAQTVVPVSHLLWGGCWTGCAAAAVNKARAFVRQQARRAPGTVPPTALRLAELVSMQQSLRSAVAACLHEYQLLSQAEQTADGVLSSLSYSVKINNLKIAASEALPQLVMKALQICGIQAYRNDQPYSMSRHLRDSLSAALMVGNDRMLATNANLLLVLKDD
ncbi:MULTISPECIES: acyl-CoA dehydrogenase family protein [unclassified Undibacterium]|uniref:acyl-CoA dehydrogenase family protein n=1 Tax=unclassified Undibacterium TaxID=2630295 RepID=UPI002AC8F1BE|nr:MULTISPECIES: acyl-CoA dehydrogenase family protein [unclassified Undibacterium]MEB0138983.1 acyl-CoA dehydrogenase family protein [Undibacterium sp. CCC2.1]MEB0171922.1 acyl-CoA dehydrogenase family protein [Undibacterium sp. CCC1.1]MEB0175863.1 acyl-CoA dehydrogenase family protein [Undibacterium sp. CCC3.4]MEB0215071.1 acyl-CoA dehydrogenase family protein [Undibacterium sp. 5I2]WPX45043.1 acyl-CoA dehydrogenase family protein [Undibacterium sp. CCC3.4]